MNSDHPLDLWNVTNMRIEKKKDIVGGIKLAVILTSYSSIVINEGGILDRVFDRVLLSIPLIFKTQNLSKLVTYNASSLMLPICIVILMFTILMHGSLRIKRNLYLFCLIISLLFQVLSRTITVGVVSVSTYIPLYSLLIIITLCIYQLDPNDIIIYLKRFVYYYSCISSILIIINFITKSASYSISLEFDYFRDNRVSGIEYDAELACIFLAFAIWFMIRDNTITNRKKLSYIAIYGIAGLMTGCRLFLILIVVLAFFSMFLKKKFTDVRIMASLILVPLVIMAIISIFAEGLTHFLLSDTSRLDKYKLAISMIKNNPLLGNGAYSFTQTETMIKGSGTNPHNFILELFTEYGVIIGTLYFLPLFVCLKRCIEEQNKLMFGLISIFFISSMVISIQSSFAITNLILLSAYSVLAGENNIVQSKEW